MAIAATTVWEWRTTATANAVNGGGFNASNATPGTDYSQQNTAHLTITDLVIGADNTTVTSALTPFDAADCGNILHITAGVNFTAGWYEVVSVGGVIATLDRACGTALATGGTAYLGGSLNVGALEDAFFEQLVAGNIVYFYNNNNAASQVFTLSASISITVGAGSAASPITVAGYKTTRGDNPAGEGRPTIACGALNMAWATIGWIVKNLIYTLTSSNGIGDTGATSGAVTFKNCKVTNSSGSADRNGFFPSASAYKIMNCEAISTLGDAIQCDNLSPHIFGCYIHDSKNGILATTGAPVVIGNVFDNLSTAGMNYSGTGIPKIFGNVFYGAEGKAGIALNLSTCTNVQIVNNIIYGWTTGVSFTASTNTAYLDYNDFYNNTTDVSNCSLGENDITTNPNFTDAANGDFTVQSGSPVIGTGLQIGTRVGAVGSYKVNIGVDQDDNTAAGGGGGWLAGE